MAAPAETRRDFAATREATDAPDAVVRRDMADAPVAADRIDAEPPIKEGGPDARRTPANAPAEADAAANEDAVNLEDEGA